MPTRKPPIPEDRPVTIRQSIQQELESAPATARDLSQAVRIREKDVAQHLEHLERSLVHEGKRLVVDPPECLACGFVFRERKRYTRPSACPKCRAERIEPPRFRIEAAG